MIKRAGIARALALGATILLLDEPSAGLDPITAANLDETILRLRKNLNCTFVIVSHELKKYFPDCRPLPHAGSCQQIHHCRRFS